MNDFTASNGITVFVREGGTVRFQHGTRFESCGILQIMPGSEWWEALREFFQAEADERLGRWRWPADPDFIVYETREQQAARVLRESTGQALDYLRSEPRGSRPSAFGAAVHAYFDAHPEPKPAWNEARDGEVWVLTVNGVEDAWAFRVREWERVRDGSLLRGAPLSPGITAGRRIYPEAVAS